MLTARLKGDVPRPHKGPRPAAVPGASKKYHKKSDERRVLLLGEDTPQNPSSQGSRDMRTQAQRQDYLLWVCQDFVDPN